MKDNRHGEQPDKKLLQEAVNLHWRAPTASLNILLTSTCWRNDHNGFSHQGPGLIDVMPSKRGTVARIYLPSDANCLMAVADHCRRSRNYVNPEIRDWVWTDGAQPIRPQTLAAAMVALSLRESRVEAGDPSSLTGHGGWRGPSSR